MLPILRQFSELATVSRPTHRSHLPATAAATIESIFPIRFEPRHHNAGRHRQALEYHTMLVTAAITAERLAPNGARIARLTGALALAAGAVMCVFA